MVNLIITTIFVQMILRIRQILSEMSIMRERNKVIFVNIQKYIYL